MSEALVRLKFDDKTKNASRGAIKNLDSIRNSASTLIGVLGGVSGALVLRNITNTIVSFERLEASLVAVTGSAELASKEFNMIKDFATETPFQVEKITEAFIRLEALGLDPTRRSLESFGNTASAMGKDIIMFAEAVADGITGEFERLKEFGIKARNDGDTIRFIFQGVTTTVKNDAASINDYLMSIGENQFAGAMSLQMQTLGGAFSNLKDASSQLSEAIGKAGLSGVLSGGASIVTELSVSITELVREMEQGATVAETFGKGLFQLLHGDELRQLTDEYEKQADLIAEISALESSTGFLDNVFGGAKLSSLREELALTEAKIIGLNNLVQVQADQHNVEEKINKDLEDRQALRKGAENAVRSFTESEKELTEFLSTKAAQAAKEQLKAVEKRRIELERNIESNDEFIEQIKFEISALSMSSKELEVNTAIRQLNDDATEEQINKVKKLTTALHEERTAIEDAEEQAKKLAEESEKAGEFGKELGLTFSSAFEDAIVNGAKFSDVLKGIEKDILRILVRKAITEPLANAVGGLFSGSGGLSGLIPKFDTGTDYVPEDTLAMVHKGEKIIPASENKSNDKTITIINNFNITSATGTIDQESQMQVAQRSFEATSAAARRLG